MSYEEDVPPAGTRCAGCRDHWCAARCYRGNETPLCLGCANGVDCDVIRARRMTEDELLGRFNSPATDVRDVTPVDAAERVVLDAPVEVRRNDCGKAIGMGSTPMIRQLESRKLEVHEIANIFRVKPEELFRVEFPKTVEPVVDVAPVALEEEKAMPEKVGVKCAVEGCDGSAYGGKPYCSKKHGWKNSDLAKGKERKPASLRPPRAVPSKPQTVEIGGNRPGTASALLGALDRQDARHDEGRTDGKDKASHYDLAAWKRGDASIVSRAAVVEPTPTVTVELVFSPKDLRVLIGVMSDDQLFALASGGLKAALVGPAK